MLKDEALALQDSISQVRQYLHAHPELSFEEKVTTAYLADKLREMNISVTTFPDHYGLLAEIGDKRKGKTVLLRADIDALPIVEKSGVPFASKTEGRMHACGHDGHTAMLLGAAKILKNHEQELQGRVILLFQSGEESGHGANWYVNQGITENVDACFALHVQPTVPRGKISLDPGYRTTSCTDFILTVNGTSAHGSTPHLGHDAIVAASAAIMNAQTLVSRVNDAQNPLVVTFGKITAGQQFNIICDEVKIIGTIRTYDQNVYREMPQKLLQLFQDTAKIYGCTASMEIITDEPMCCNNDEVLLTAARQAAQKLWGNDVLYAMPSMMGSEDFAFFMDKVPGVLGFLGIGDEQHKEPLHSDHFVMDDTILYQGTGLYAQFALDALNALKKEA